MTAAPPDHPHRPHRLGRLVLIGAAAASAGAIAGSPPPPPTETPQLPLITPAPSTTACLPDPQRCGFASARTTGVPAGTVLRPSASVIVTRSGTVLDGLDITGTLTIRASDVTVRNTRVRGSGYSLIGIDAGATGVVIDRVEVEGLGRDGTPGMSGIVGGSATITRTRISGVENAFIPGSGTQIHQSYVHGLDSGGDPHYDGVQIDGGVSDITVTGSTIDLSDHTQTSAVMIDNYDGDVRRVTISGNLLAGGGYTVYADGSFSTARRISSVTYANNRLVPGYYGFHVVRNADVHWSGNVVDRTGAPVGE